MKLLIATGLYPHSHSFPLPYEIGGPASYTKKLVESLPEHDFTLKVVSYGERKQIIKNCMTEVFWINRYSFLLIRYLSYFLCIFKLLKWADLTYVQGPISEGIPVWLATCLRRKKYVLKVVGDYAWEQGVQRFGVTDLMDDFQHKKYDLRTELMRFFEYFIARSAEKIIVPSNYLKKIVKQWGVQDKKIEVVYNAVEFKAVPAMQFKPANEKWIVSVGRLVPWKGMDTLIEIMPELLQEFPNLKLKIVGHGPVFEGLRLKIESLKLKDSIRLTGDLPHNQTLSFIHTADIFVLNSAYEGLSHVILEALYFNTPVIASDVGGNPEIVGHGSLFKYNNKEEIKSKIIEILNSTKVASESKINLEQFSFKTMLENTKKILEEVCAS